MVPPSDSDQLNQLFYQIGLLHSKVDDLCNRVDKIENRPEIATDEIIEKLKYQIIKFSWCSFVDLLKNSRLVQALVLFYILGITSDIGVWLGRLHDFYPVIASLLP